jgi:CRISPR-associated protein Cas5t
MTLIESAPTQTAVKPLVVHVSASYANFRKSFARNFAESYTFAPPATVYGMLLSLVGERDRNKHLGVRLGFAYRNIPDKSKQLTKMSRFKYGVAAKQLSKVLGGEDKGHCPDFVETTNGLDFLIAIDSSYETAKPTLAERVQNAIEHPETVERTGVLCLGLSDNIVGKIEIAKPKALADVWFRLLPSKGGTIDLPSWVDHRNTAGSRWARFFLDDIPQSLGEWPAERHLTPIEAN